MMTWRLWQVVKNPLFAHPLFWRVGHTPALHNLRLDRWFVVFAAGLMVGVVLMPSFTLNILFILISAGLLILPLLVIFILLSANLYSLFWTASISSAITRQHERGIYDLTAISPAGPLATSWAILSGCMHYNQNFFKLRRQMRILVMVTLPVILWFVVTQQTAPQKLIASVSVMTLVSAFYVDYMQSVIIGGLMGMLMAVFARSRFDALVWSVSAFLAVQVVTYAIVGVVDFSVLPGVYDLFGWNGELADISLPLLRLLFFFALREAIITGLWRALAQRLNVDLTELDAVRRLAL